MSSACVSCPALNGCPKCAAGELCQMSVPPICSECPVNKCIADPNYRAPASKNKGIAGGLFGMISAFVILAALYSVYRKRQKKKERLAEAARFAEKLKAAEEEKFRPGQDKKDSAKASDMPEGNGGDGNVSGSQDQHYSITMARSDAITTSLYDRSNLDDDTEWSELREDGHTTVSMMGDSTQGETVFAGHLLRQSAGAATHLSRITEGIEEEEEVQRQRASQQRYALPKSRTIKEEASIEMTDMPPNRTWSITNVNPFADSMEGVNGSRRDFLSPNKKRDSDSYQFEIGHRWSAMTVELPSAVHRPVGSPLIAVPSNANPKAGTARKSQLYSPLSALARSPSKKNTKPDWGKVCDEIKDGQVTSTPALRVYDNASHSHEQDPESYSVYESAETHRKDLSNTGEAETFADASNRLSVMSTSTVDSVAYSMMSSQIVTPHDKGGIQRLQLKQSKAQLVRVNSERKAGKGGKEDQENEIRQRKSHSVSMLDSICDVDVNTLKAPMQSREGSGDSNAHLPSTASGDESGLDPAMTPYRLSAIISTSKSESMLSNDSFGLPPFKDSPTDEDNIEGFLQRCTSDTFRHDSITSAHTDYSQQREDEDRHDREIYRESNSTITGLSVLDDIPFEVHSNENSHESTETLKSTNEHFSDALRRQQNRF